MPTGHDRVIRSFSYRMKPLLTTLLLLASVAGAVFLAYFAWTNNREVNIKGIVLTPGQGRMLFGVFAALSPLGIGALGYGLYMGLAHPGRVALTTTSAIVPRPSRLGVSREEIEIPFAEIVAVQVVPITRWSKVLQLVTRTSGVVTLSSDLFPGKGDFAEAAALLSDAVESDRATRG